MNDQMFVNPSVRALERSHYLAPEPSAEHAFMRTFSRLHDAFYPSQIEQMQCRRGGIARGGIREDQIRPVRRAQNRLPRVLPTFRKTNALDPGEPVGQRLQAAFPLRIACSMLVYSTAGPPKTTGESIGGIGEPRLRGPNRAGEGIDPTRHPGTVTVGLSGARRLRRREGLSRFIP